MAKLFGPKPTSATTGPCSTSSAPRGCSTHDSDEAPLDGAVDAAFRYGIVGTIYGGSSEIMREIVAQRHLGLPRNRPK